MYDQLSKYIDIAHPGNNDRLRRIFAVGNISNENMIEKSSYHSIALNGVEQKPPQPIRLGIIRDNNEIFVKFVDPHHLLGTIEREKYTTSAPYRYCLLSLLDEDSKQKIVDNCCRL